MPALLPHDIPIKSPPGLDGTGFHASILGKALTIKGVLDTVGDLYIHGNVIGRINTDYLVLGINGYVEGDVVARNVCIAGRLIGRIFAINVMLDSSANVTGRIFHNTITIAKGARIDGRMPWRPPNYFDALKQLPEARS